MNHHPVRIRPKLARYLFDRNLADRAVALELECSHETIRLICLPFDDAARRVPNSGLMRRIFDWTGGECPPASFYPYDPAGEVSAAACADQGEAA